MNAARSKHPRRAGGAKKVILPAVALAVALAALPAPPAAPLPGAQNQDALLFEARPLGREVVKPPPFLDSRLAQLADIARRDGFATARRFAAVNAIRLDAQGRANVLIHAGPDPDYAVPVQGEVFDPEQRIGRVTPGEEAIYAALQIPVSERVENLGGEYVGRVANLIDARVPIGALGGLDGPAITWVEPMLFPHRHLVSEGVGVIRADELQSSPASYQGGEIVKVGVIDLGFKGYTSLLGSELPASVTVNSFSAGGIEGTGLDILDAVHGTACAEIVHDVAPDAQLFFADIDTISGNSNAVDWMIGQGVQIISYSLGWTNAGPGDGRGPINDAVRRAMDAGIEWAVAAGNEARDHWMGTFNDPDGDGFHNFSGADNSNAVFLNAGQELVVFLNWDDWFNSNQDYDLYIYDSGGAVVALSENAQFGFQNPTEAIGFTAPTAGTYHVRIRRFSATRNVELEMFFRSPRELQYIVPGGSLSIPADTDGVVAAGATYFGSDVIEFFSSQGPTKDGRTKPDLTAPDGVATRSYGDLGFVFFGTSASAPHAAGAMALMKSRFGIFDLGQIREILLGRALDRGAAGFDNVYGRGRLDLKGQ